MAKNVVFKVFKAPGDIVVLTSLPKIIKDKFIFSDEFLFDLFTPYPEITFNNPYLTKFKKEEEKEIIELDYGPHMKQLRQYGVHFSYAYLYDFNEKFEANIQFHSSYLPEIYLTDEEKDRKQLLNFGIFPETKFWMFNAGIKIDMPLKGYPPFLWQIVVNECNKNGINLFQVGSHQDIHPELKNVKYNLIGKTENIRDFLILAYHSEGCICHVSFPMHVMAAFKKPCIVIAGGRENPRWEAYDFHQFIHTIGQLDCCKYDGCWKKQRNECEKMVVGEQIYPECMMMISPYDIVGHILKYNYGGYNGNYK